MTDNALAVRDKRIQTRMELNKQAGYGLEKANKAQLNIIFLLCQRYGLDPVTDITLFQGRPFITIDGRLRLLRKHPEYRGYTCRPLGAPEKEMWGYAADDVVVECTIRTTSYGEISARGKCNPKEGQPVGKLHPVELAEKRAIARAERAAFGMDTVLDDDEVSTTTVTLVQERDDPVKIAADSARYAEIFPPNYDEDSSSTSDATAPPEPDVVSEPPAAGSATGGSGLGDALQRNSNLYLDAMWVGIKKIGHLRADENWNADQIEAANVELGRRISEQPAA